MGNRIVAIHPAGLAAMNIERAGQKYQPSNGTEGDIFMSAWCCECQRDRSMREGDPIEECDDNQRCDIIANTMFYDVSDPAYPSEWQYGQDGQPRCTAFVEAGEPIPHRCEHTPDLFAHPTATEQKGESRG
jgi:hypothetical protein